MVGKREISSMGLPHQVVTGSIVRIRIERIHFQNTTGKDIHDILSFQVEDIHLGFRSNGILSQIKPLKEANSSLSGNFPESNR